MTDMLHAILHHLQAGGFRFRLRPAMGILLAGIAVLLIAAFSAASVMHVDPWSLPSHVLAGIVRPMCGESAGPCY